MPKSKKKGRPTHKPNAHNKQKIKDLVLAGIDQETICGIIGISKPTLHKHYRDVLDNTMAEANQKIAGKIYQMALAGDRALLMFWAKTRMGWRETDREGDSKQSVELPNVIVNVIPKSNEDIDTK